MLYDTFEAQNILNALTGIKQVRDRLLAGRQYFNEDDVRDLAATHLMTGYSKSISFSLISAIVQNRTILGDYGSLWEMFTTVHGQVLSCAFDDE